MDLVVDMKNISKLIHLQTFDDFNHLDLCWKDYTSRHTQVWRFLQSTDDNFLM